ncbi:MFS transporter [Ancylobacter terrae]|uniref:MFS transporter n=1 Tax=Ancylobacter sp. sgz301288 TaxID=3342077 RepID=UPI00385C9BA0
MTSLLSRLLAEPAPAAFLERQSWHHWLVVGLVSIGAFVGQLDATIVQLALPTLSRAFDARLQEVSWVALAYLLAFASFLPVFGRLCEIMGRKTLYVLGYALFIAASALCALSTSFGQLLAFRALQGIGGALLGANSIAILLATVPLASRGRALGFLAAAQAVGMSAGPALGGLILATLGWRWIFWVSVPFGAVAVILGWLALPRTAPGGTAMAFDWRGAILIGPALILVVGTLNHLSQWGLVSPLTLGSLIAAAVLFWLLVRRETSTASPLISPRLFGSLGFCCGAIGVGLAYALLYGTFFLMSFAQEHGFGESPAEAGFRLAIIPAAIGLVAPFSQDVARRLGAGRVGIAGMACCLLGVGLMILAVGDPAHHRAFDTVAFLLIGTGLGIFIAPNNTAAIGALPPELSGPAGSLINLMRALGTSLGVASGATMLAWRLDVAGGSGADWMSVGAQGLLDAVRGSFPVLAVLAIAAALAARVAATHVLPPRTA